MSNAPTALLRGFDFQARVFWHRASEMLLKPQLVGRVGYEVEGLCGWDDVVVEYANGFADEFSDPLKFEVHQVKFHVDATHSITTNDFIDPAFLGTKQASLLKRLAGAKGVFDSRGVPFRACFWTSASIHPDDLLARLVDSEHGALHIHRLQDGGPKSKTGKLRAAWREHLELGSDEELVDVLRPLRLLHGHGPARMLACVNEHCLHFLGVAETGVAGGPANPLDDLIRKLRGAGRQYFTADELTNEIKRAGLGPSSPQSKPKCLAIRSFSPWANFLDSEADELLCLLPHFCSRELKEGTQWGEIVPMIRSFIEESPDASRRNTLHLCAHQTIAFAAGYFLPFKSGVEVDVVQSSKGRRELWSWSGEAGQGAPSVDVEVETIDVNGGGGCVLALGLTHDIRSSVREHIKSLGMTPRVFVYVDAANNTHGHDAIEGAGHAEHACVVAVKALRSAGAQADGKVHVFAAAPNGLLFFLGRHMAGAWKIQFYEYAFGSANRQYAASAAFGVSE